MDEKIKNFLDDIVKVYKKYNLTLSHEDGHGAFIIDNYDEYNIKWLYDALINISTEDDLPF